MQHDPRINRGANATQHQQSCGETPDPQSAKQFAQSAFKDEPLVPFRAPAGIRMVRIDRRSGRKVFGVWPTSDPKAPVIWEAFKPESEPRRTVRKDEFAEVAKAEQAQARAAAGQRKAQQQDSDFLQKTGGIY